MKWAKKDNSIQTVEQLVIQNTGMTLEHLNKDTRVYQYPGISEAADLFLDHVRRGSKIQVWCDYDTDGVDSKFIMSYTVAKPLKIRNISIDCPGRYTDGYGIKPSIVEKFIGANLLVLCDNGIAAIEAIDLAREMGMDVIVLDHHEPRVIDGKEVLPNANVIVDPHVTGGYIMEKNANGQLTQVGTFEDLCGAGIAYYFSHEVRSKCAWMSDKWRWYLDQVAVIGAAIGTVGDVVNLVDDNRRIVKQGISNMNKGMGTAGIQKLLARTYLQSHVTSTDIGFTISPIVNAYGRLEDAGPNKIANILCSDATEGDALSALDADITEAIEMNKKRKEMTRETVDRVIEMYEQNGGDDAFIVCYDEWTITGLVGLVAGELVSKYHKPALVFAPAKEDGVIKGSGRSVEGIDIKSLLDQVQQYLTTYGGHPMACGASMLIENLDDFGDAINAITPVLEASDVLYYDIETTTDQAANVLAEQEKLEPYGAGNPLPVYRFNSVFLGQPSYMGGNSEHIKFKVGDNDVVWFYGREGYEALGSPEKVDMLVTMSYHYFKDETTIQMQVIDLVPAD